MARTILRKCRPIYKIGTLVLQLGMLTIIIGLVGGWRGSGWLTLYIGIGCAVLGILIGQVAEGTLTNEIKIIIPSITAKQAHDLAAPHLQANGPDVDNTEVFLGKLIGELEYQNRKNRS